MSRKAQAPHPPRSSDGARDRGDLDALRAQLVAAERAARGRKERRKTRNGERDPEKRGLEEGDPEEGTAPLRREEREAVHAPRPVVGGLPARTRKGPIGATWWSRRFLGSLESAMARDRMARGRAYARRGQVVDLRVAPGRVEATVQGSREEPYAVRLRLPVVPDEDWARILAALSTRAGYAARMLAGELPDEVEQVFESEGASLLPAPHARLVAECTCPDWENPCAHAAAVCYLLAEELDREPFSLLEWRGRGREEVLAELRGLRHEAAGARSDPDESARSDPDEGARALDGRELLARFWTAGPSFDHVRVLPEVAPAPAAALRLTVRGTIRVGGGDLADVLAPAYRRIAAAAAARARR